MLRNIFLLTFLVCSVCSVHLEIREVESSEDVDEISTDRTAEQMFDLCWACKWIMEKVKKRVYVNSTPDEIKNKLFATCDQIIGFKKQCKNFLQKYVSTLVEELSTTDGPNTICKNLGICKPKLLFSKDFILSFEEVFDNL